MPEFYAMQGMMTITFAHGLWHVHDGDKIVQFRSNAEAWEYVDRHTFEGQTDEDRRRRIDTAFA